MYDTEPELKDLKQDTYDTPFEWDKNPADINKWIADGSKQEDKF